MIDSGTDLGPALGLPNRQPNQTGPQFLSGTDTTSQCEVNKLLMLLALLGFCLVRLF